MRNIKELKYYSPLEEKLNVVSHALGLLLSIIALVFLVYRAISLDNIWCIISFSIFGLSLIALYAASTFYHKSNEPALRYKLKILDHATIFILIAGTYTPYTLVTLHGRVGWIIFGVTWGLALAGVILKLFFVGKYNIASTVTYVIMGWIIIFAIKPLVNNLSPEGLQWLFAGGVFYTVGAVLYSIKKIKFNHAIFHVFVLLGSFCHVVSVYYYVIPIE